jgi:hypothetical protein
MIVAMRRSNLKINVEPGLSPLVAILVPEKSLKVSIINFCVRLKQSSQEYHLGLMMITLSIIFRKTLLSL